MSDQTQNMELRGLGISPGLAVGQAYIYRDILQRDHELYDIDKGEIDDEYGRIERAIEDVTQDLRESAAQVEKDLEEAVAEVFVAQEAMLHDPYLRKEFREELEKELVNAEHIVKRVLLRWERKFRAVEDEVFRQRREDVIDLGRRLLRNLAGIQAHTLESMPKASALVARRLLPSDTVFLSRQSTAAVVIEFGGRGSHAALLTREMGVPAVAEVSDLQHYIAAKDKLLVDGDHGVVIVNPDDETEQSFKKQIDGQRTLRAQAHRRSHGPARTKCGTVIQVMANIGCREDAVGAADNGAEGVGLYRLERLYLARKLPPTEDELFENIREALAPVKDRSVNVRLLDAGGDKDIPFLNLPAEPDPFLGRRGVRLLLAYPDLLKTQLRVLIRLCQEHDVRVLVPFVTLAEEMSRVREVLNEVADDIQPKKVPPLGAMIETPASALCTSELAEQADFLSVGTNDLTQYTLAVGRENPLVAKYFVDDHPSVLRLLKLVMSEAKDVPVAVCGELAGRQEAIPQLLQIGIRTLSVAPPMIPLVKEAIRETSV